MLMLDRYTRLQIIKDKKICVKEKTINSYPTHWHEFYEIELIVSGEGKYIIDGEEHMISKNMLFFMTPVNFHRVITENSRVFTLMFMGEACDRDVLFRLATSFEADSVLLSDEDAQYLASLIHELYLACLEDDDTYCFHLLNSILGKLCRVNNIHKHRCISKVQKAMLYIQNNFRNDIGLCEVAKEIGVTPSYMSSIFARECGINFKEYLNTIRYDYAKKLLEYSDMTVTDICFESGFYDYANFERHFKERYGMSPKQYKKKCL